MDIIIDILVSYGIYGVMIAAFCEAIFMPVPMELVSIPIYLANPSNAFLYSVVLILFSLLGSTAGYHIGKLLGLPLIGKLSSMKYISQLKNLYAKNAFLTVLTSSFTPIPYEVYALSAGIFNIGFTKYILASIISRVIRHLPQGILIYMFGGALVGYIKKYTLIIAVIIFTAVLILNYLKPRRKKRIKESGKLNTYI
jgi:membrane protein YqaA with SNARE-associated domain